MDRRILEIAAEVHDLAGSDKPPIQPQEIARAEGITVMYLDSPDYRFGRIEMYREYGQFAIYCKRNEYSLPNPLQRFSVAHELGHYYLPEHRAVLEQGHFHTCRPGSVTNKSFERDADNFAGALLIPEMYLWDKIKTKGYLGLEELRQIADECIVSLTATTVRYIDANAEACGMVVSRDGAVEYYWPSDAAQAEGFSFLGKRTVPQSTITRKAGDSTEPKVLCQESDTSQWFSDRLKRGKVWEEAFKLGNTGMVLTLLSMKIEKNEEEWDEWA